jgi:uncharacterized protein
VKADPELDFGWWTMQRLRYLDSKRGLLPRLRRLFGTNTLDYLRPGFSPEKVGSTAERDMTRRSGWRMSRCRRCGDCPGR